MLSIDSAQKLIAKEIEKINFPASPADLYDPVRYILSAGGKRIRPVLVLLGCDLFGEDYNKALSPAIGIEVFHNFTLLHDDLMDNSSIRRKNPTVHIKWNPNVAILSGDVMSILANQFICKVEDKILPKALDLFNSCAQKVCEGQMMDMNFENESVISLNSYFEMIGLKTSVLIATCLKMGSVVAKTTPENSEYIYEYGFNLGQAFQLQDDYLDIYGEEKSFGKKIGNDIVTNKKTFLYIKAMELASGKKLIQLKNLFYTTEIDPSEKIQIVTNIYSELDIRDHTEKQINLYFKKASEKLGLIDVAPERKNVLKEFSNLLISRKS